MNAESYTVYTNSGGERKLAVRFSEDEAYKILAWLTTFDLPDILAEFEQALTETVERR